jgi:hypothetical protein
MLYQLKHTKQSLLFAGFLLFDAIYNFSDWECRFQKQYRVNRELSHSWYLFRIMNNLRYMWHSNESFSTATWILQTSCNISRPPAHSPCTQYFSFNFNLICFQHKKLLCAACNPTHTILSKQTISTSIKNKTFTVSWHLLKKVTLPKNILCLPVSSFRFLLFSSSFLFLYLLFISLCCHIV